MLYQKIGFGYQIRRVDWKIILEDVIIRLDRSLDQNLRLDKQIRSLDQKSRLEDYTRRVDQKIRVEDQIRRLEEKGRLEDEIRGVDQKIIKTLATFNKI